MQQDSIKVAVRFRPLDFSTTSPIIIEQTRPGILRISGEKTEFMFDVAYGDTTSQSEIFEGLGRPLVEDVLSGYNGTLFTYGQTGSGKTYTMYGDENAEGLVPRISRYIFDAVEKADTSVEYSIKCSMLEIYKEKLRDLLDFDAKKTLRVKESPSLGLYVDGLRSEWVVSEEELRDVIDCGLHMRVVSATYQNQKSSRSHLLCIIEIEQKRANGVEKRGMFNLVDLAGSEKLRTKDPLGEKVEETKKINFSLSVLGKVIYALNSRAKHVPYRDSKLTRVLQESLGGNFRTTLISCCSSSPSYLEETLSTLKFAQRVKVIRNVARINLKRSAAAYETIILDLQASTGSVCVDYLNKENLGKESMTIGLFESQIVADFSATEWPQTSIANQLKEVAELTQQNEDLKEKNKDLTERLQACEMKLLSVEKKHLEREMELITELRQQSVHRDPETDPKDVLITSLRHQVISLRTTSIALQKKIDRLLQSIPPDEVCKMGDVWEEEDFGEEEESIGAYSDVLREAYADLTQDSAAVGTIGSLRHESASLQCKLDFSSSKNAQLEKSCRQWQDLLDQSQYLNKRLFKAYNPVPPQDYTHTLQRHRLARKVQGGRRMDSMVSPSVTSRLPEMVMTSPKTTGESDEALQYRLKGLELKLQLQCLENAQLQSLLQNQATVPKPEEEIKPPAVSSSADFRPAVLLYEGELLRRHEQLESLSEVLSAWIHKYMELQDKVGIPTSSCSGHKRSLSEEHIAELRRLVELTRAIQKQLNSDPPQGDESPPVFFNTD